MGEFRAGQVALIGKPNVGKSTLMNAMVGQKVSIVSDKPQTTRRRIVGISTTEDYQIVFVDTPGIHDAHTALGKAMNEQARRALAEIDAIVFVGDVSHHPGEPDNQIAALIRANRKERELPLILCLNKMDQLKAENVQRNVDAFCELLGSDNYMLTTATQARNIDKLAEMIVEVLPERHPLYGPDELTDQSSRFMAGEFVREKILNLTRQEIPHATAVTVEDWSEEPHIIRVRANIIVEKPSQRAILIGKQGAFIKRIGTTARQEIEELLGKPLFLDLHVKVVEDWRMSPRILHELEYDQ
ncbi:Era GTPase [Fimbriimonadaceae bacterium]|jgi:GTP-binding protein Era